MSQIHSPTQLQHKPSSSEQMTPVCTYLDAHSVLLNSDANSECQNVSLQGKEREELEGNSSHHTKPCPFTDEETEARRGEGVWEGGCMPK